MRTAIRALDRKIAFGHHIYPEVSLEALIEAMQPRGKTSGLLERFARALRKISAMKNE